MLVKLILLAVTATVCLAGSPKVFGNPRPCLLNDYRCIRRNLSGNSKCNPRTRPVERQYTVPRQRFETPHFNASYIDHNLTVSGQHRCFVSEFFFNVNTDSGVLGIDCPWLTFSSTRTLLQHWPLQEDSTFRYKIKGTYPLIRLTMTLDNADVLDICKEFTFAYVAQLPFFSIIPIDVATQEFLSQDLSLLNIFERETFFYRANMLARKFINTQLCDFGCD